MFIGLQFNLLLQCVIKIFLEFLDNTGHENLTFYYWCFIYTPLSFQANLYNSKPNCSSFVAQGSYTQYQYIFIVVLCTGLEVCCQAVGSTPGRFFTNIIAIDGPWGRELAAEGRICVGEAQARKKQGACCDGSQCLMLLRLSFYRNYMAQSF